MKRLMPYSAGANSAIVAIENWQAQCPARAFGAVRFGDARVTDMPGAWAMPAAQWAVNILLAVRTWQLLAPGFCFIVRPRWKTASQFSGRTLLDTPP
jgi:hypothetical protein